MEIEGIPFDKSSQNSSSGFFDTSSEFSEDNTLAISNNFTKSITTKEDKNIEHRFGQPTNLQNQFSISNDLKIGWQPKVGIKNPFPIYYYDKLTEYIEQNGKYFYRGFRPSHSYKLHSAYSGGLGCYEYNNKSFQVYKNEELNKFYKLDSPNDLPKGTKRCSQGVEFDSFFESGNCDIVEEDGLFKYNVYLRVDSNTQGHTHWFYFRVRRQFSTTIKILVKNMSKSKSIFQKTGAPYYSFDNQQWKQLDGAKYYQTFLPSQVGLSYRKVHTLEFQVEIPAGRWVYIAYCPPYTYSTLINYLDTIKNLEHVKVSQLCMSESLLDVPLVRITSPSKYDNQSAVNKEARAQVVIIGRVHPGETCGSHMMQGVLEFLTQMENKLSQILRSTFEFVVVPMMNVDGVILGNFRTGLSGDDLNRSYVKPSPQLHPSVFELKQLLSNPKGRKTLFMLDLHGHSTKPNVFSYGPDHSKSDPFYYYSRLFTKLMDMRNIPFQFKKSTWKIHRSKNSTARAVFLKKKVKFCYTIEASTAVYEDENGEFQRLSVQKYQEVGRDLMMSLHTLILVGMKEPHFLKNLFPSSIVGTEYIVEGAEQWVKDLEYHQILNGLAEEERQSEHIVEGGSDSESSDEDLPSVQKKAINARIMKQIQKYADGSSRNQNVDKFRKKKQKLPKGKRFIRKTSDSRLSIKEIKPPIQISNAKPPQQKIYSTKKAQKYKRRLDLKTTKIEPSNNNIVISNAHKEILQIMQDRKLQDFNSGIIPYQKRKYSQTMTTIKPPKITQNPKEESSKKLPNRYISMTKINGQYKIEGTTPHKPPIIPNTLATPENIMRPSRNLRSSAIQTIQEAILHRNNQKKLASMLQNETLSDHIIVKGILKMPSTKALADPPSVAFGDTQGLKGKNSTLEKIKLAIVLGQRRLPNLPSKK